MSADAVDLVRFECATGCEGSEWDVWGDWRTEEELIAAGDLGAVVPGAPRDIAAARTFVPEGGLEALLCPSCLRLGREQELD